MKQTNVKEEQHITESMQLGRRFCALNSFPYLCVNQTQHVTAVEALAPLQGSEGVLCPGPQ